MDRLVPVPSLLNALRAEKPSLLMLLAEAIDNAFDVNATTVRIATTASGIGIEDDGPGLTRDREEAMLTLGKHGAVPTTRLGMFGVGIKWQAMAMGGTLTINSVSRDGAFHADIDWDAMERSGNWDLERPTIWSAARPDAITGMTVQVERLRTTKPLGKAALVTVRERLALMFQPALAEGRQIILNGEPIQLLGEPAMSNIVQAKIELPGGRTARLRAGLLTGTPSPGLTMMHLSYGHRVIEIGKDFGTGNLVGVSRIFGRLHLSGEWPLDRFKDAIGEGDERDLLQERVEELLAPLLAKASAKSMSAVLDELTAALNDRDALNPARAKKKKLTVVVPEPDDEDEGEPRQRPQHGITNDPTDDADGPARAYRKHRVIIIEFAPGVDECGIGKVVHSSSKGTERDRIVLADDCPVIIGLIGLKDFEVKVASLYSIAMLLLENARTNTQPSLFGEPFGLSAWKRTEFHFAHDREAAE